MSFSIRDPAPTVNNISEENLPCLHVHNVMNIQQKVLNVSLLKLNFLMLQNPVEETKTLKASIPFLFFHSMRTVGYIR